MKFRESQIGDIKTKRKFLILPEFFGEHWYWWETVTLKYKLEWRKVPIRIPLGMSNTCALEKSVKRWTLIDLRQDNE